MNNLEKRNSRYPSTKMNIPTVRVRNFPNRKFCIQCSTKGRVYIVFSSLSGKKSKKGLENVSFPKVHLWHFLQRQLRP